MKSITDPDVYYLLNSDMLLIDQLDKLLSEIEKHIKERAYHHNGTDYSLLKSVTGVGDMLALSILYLKWAYGQIITHARQSSDQINAYYQKLEAKRCAKLARGIMSHKFAVAVYHMLKKKVAFDENRFLKVAS